jgi:hypothetical protein
MIDSNARNNTLFVTIFVETMNLAALMYYLINSNRTLDTVTKNPGHAGV